MNGPVISAEGATDVVVNQQQKRPGLDSLGFWRSKAMSDFAGMEDLLQDFLQEANDFVGSGQQAGRLRTHARRPGPAQRYLPRFHTIGGGLQRRRAGHPAI